MCYKLYCNTCVTSVVECAFHFTSGHTVCVYLCVCDWFSANCFPIWLNTERRRRKTSYHKVRCHTIHILPPLGCGKLIHSLSPPRATFLLPPARLTFRNLQNLLPIDFPLEFGLLLKSLMIKKEITSTPMWIRTHITTQLCLHSEIRLQNSHLLYIYRLSPTHTQTHWLSSRDLF